MKLKQSITLVCACIICLFSMAQDGVKTLPEQCEKSVTCAKPKRADLSAVLAGWKGSYNRNGIKYDVIMDVKRKEGDVISVVSIPQLGIEKQECRLSVCSGNEIHISPRSTTENLTITISTINAGVLKGKVHHAENDCSLQYALAMNVITKI